MSDKPTKPPEKIRWPTAFVILVLATIGFFVFWQLILEGQLTRHTPEQVVREFLRLGLPTMDGFEINDLSVLDEVQTPERHVKAAAVRVQYRAKNGLGQIGSYDKIFIVVGDQVKGGGDWSPQMESQIRSMIEKLQKK